MLALKEELVIGSMLGITASPVMIRNNILNYMLLNITELIIIELQVA